MFPAARGNAIPQSQQNHSRPTVSIGRESRGSRRKLGRSCQVLSLSVFLLSPLVSLLSLSLSRLLSISLSLSFSRSPARKVSSWLSSILHFPSARLMSPRLHFALLRFVSVRKQTPVSTAMSPLRSPVRYRRFLFLTLLLDTRPRPSHS